MKLGEILNGVDYSVKGAGTNDARAITDIEITALSHDSRAAAAGHLFFCLPGVTADGHSFAGAAAERGAAAVVAQRVPDSFDPDKTKIPLVIVENSRAALSVCAANFCGNPARRMRLVGVTGTNGKTSTTYMIEAILRGWGRVAGLIGTVHTRVGGEILDVKFATSTTPDSIELQQILAEMSRRGAEYAVMEASSHALALDKLAGMRFEAGVFTNLTQDHLDFHKTMEEYAAAKAKLFAISGCAVINADDPYAERMAEGGAPGLRVIRYAVRERAAVRAENVRYRESSSGGGMSFDITLDGRVCSFLLPVPGMFSVYNALAAISAAYALGVPMDVIKTAIDGFGGVPGRIQSVPNGRGFNVIVDYSHTPDGLENIIRAVREFTKGGVITVFGCGGDRDRTKRPIMGEIAGSMSDYCVITSDNPRTEDPDGIIGQIEGGMRKTRCAYDKEADRESAIRRAIARAKAGDSVIIAGKGHENYQIFKDRTIHFDDFETARRILSET